MTGLPLLAQTTSMWTLHLGVSGSGVAQPHKCAQVPCRPDPRCADELQLCDMAGGRNSPCVRVEEPGLPPAGRPRHADRHGRPRHRPRALPRLHAGTVAAKGAEPSLLLPQSRDYVMPRTSATRRALRSAMQRGAMPCVCNAMQERLLGARKAQATANSTPAIGPVLRRHGENSGPSSNGGADSRNQGLGEAVLYFGCRRRDQVRTRLVSHLW